MGKKKKVPRITPEEQAEFDKRTQEIWQRIAERRALEQQQARKNS